jgi:hypothetical protein
MFGSSRELRLKPRSVSRSWRSSSAETAMRRVPDCRHPGADNRVQHPRGNGRDHAQASPRRVQTDRKGAAHCIAAEHDAHRAGAGSNEPQLPLRYGQNDLVIALGRKIGFLQAPTLIEPAKVNGLDPEDLSARRPRLHRRSPDQPHRRIAALEARRRVSPRRRCRLTCGRQAPTPQSPFDAYI